MSCEDAGGQVHTLHLNTGSRQQNRSDARGRGHVIKPTASDRVHTHRHARTHSQTSTQTHIEKQEVVQLWVTGSRPLPPNPAPPTSHLEKVVGSSSVTPPPPPVKPYRKQRTHLFSGGAGVLRRAAGEYWGGAHCSPGGF